MKNLPKSWTACEVSTVAEVNPRKPKAAPDELVSFIGMADVSENMRLVSHAPRPYAEVANGFTGFEDNDILVAKITPCFENGKGALVTGLTNGKGFGSTEFHVVRADDESTRRLLYHHFSTHEFRVRGEANMTGSAGQKRIPTSFISQYVVPMPPKAAREKIVTILDACDRAIDGTAKLLEKQEKRKEGFLQRLIETHIDDMPATWKVLELSEFVEKSSGKFYPANEASQQICIELEHVSQVSGQLLGNTQTSSLSSTKNRFKIGEVLFGKLRPYLRKYLLTEFDGVCSSEFWVLRGRQNMCLNEFLFYLVQSEAFVQACTNTTGSKMPRADWNWVCEQPFALPPVEDQQRIVATLSASDKEIKLLRQQHKLLQQQKKGLMQRLLTGQAFTH